MHSMVRPFVYRLSALFFCRALSITLTGTLYCWELLAKT